MLSLETALHQRGHRTNPRSLRGALGFPVGRLTLREEPTPLRVVTYNLALLVAPGNYAGPSDFRSLAIDEVCARIEALQPDIVGLCEVFSDGEREQIYRRLKPLLPFVQEGPDESDVESDGGLLLLSRHPTQSVGASVYRACESYDCFSNKGVLYMRVAPPSGPPVDVFYSHLQAVYGGGASGKDALRKQLLHLGAYIAAFRDPARPALLLGDLNFKAEEAALYEEALQSLGRPADLWLAQRPVPSAGYTFAQGNNFYEDPSKAPKPGEDERLDYVLLYPGITHTPLLDQIEILQWSRDGRQISDHFGLHANFTRMLVVEPEAAGPIAGVEAQIIAARCLQTTDGAGADTVRFYLTASTMAGESTSNTQDRDFDKGNAHGVPDSGVSSLPGDPGEALTLRLTGLEIDKASADDSLGQWVIAIPRALLVQHRGSSFTRAMPLFGDGGEYVVTIQIKVW